MKINKKNVDRKKVMNTKKVIMALIVLMSINFVYAQGLYYAIELYYDKGDIEIKNVDVEFSNEELTNIVNERYLKTFNLDIIDRNGNVIDSVEFGVLNVIFYDLVNESSENAEFIGGGVLEYENVSFIVYVPYYETGNEIIIYDDKKQELNRKNIDKLSKISEDEILDSKDKTGGVTKISISDFKRNSGQKGIYLVLVLLIIIILLVIILIYLLIKPYKKRK